MLLGVGADDEAKVLAVARNVETAPSGTALVEKLAETQGRDREERNNDALPGLDVEAGYQLKFRVELDHDVAVHPKVDEVNGQVVRVRPAKVARADPCDHGPEEGVKRKHEKDGA